MSVPIRVRGPSGISTISVNLDGSTGTSVEDLQRAVYDSTQIPPARQEIRSGYPPLVLTLVPTLPVSSLGIKRGDMLIVSSVSGGGNTPPAPVSGAAAVSSQARAAQTSTTKPSAASPAKPKAASSRSTPAAPAPAPVPNASLFDPPTLGSASASAGEEVDSDSVPVPVDGGYLVLRVVPDDNSCLFSSIAVVFEGDMSKAMGLREVVAKAIRRDPETFNEAFLGQPPESYISTILKPTAWGGAIGTSRRRMSYTLPLGSSSAFDSLVPIDFLAWPQRNESRPQPIAQRTEELSIFADHYRTEISSFDVESGRCDRFGEGKYENRCILMYSGIHYDATSLSPTPDAPPEFHQTVFPVSSTSVFNAASKLATKRREKKAFTNTATFDLRCQVCGTGLKGETGARKHAKETGHVDFGEY